MDKIGYTSNEVFSGSCSLCCGRRACPLMGAAAGGGGAGSPVPHGDTHSILKAQTLFRASGEGRIPGETQLHPSCQLAARQHSGNLSLGAKPLIILQEGTPEFSFRCPICSVNENLDARPPTLKPVCIGRWWS